MRVLLVDDHALLREGLAALLGLHPGIEVAGQAEDGRTALRLAQSLRPDVVVIDIMMPGLNGIDTTAELLRRAPGVKVLVLSMHSGAQHVFQALAAGAHGYVLKQGASREIVEALHALQAGKRYLSPELTALVAGQMQRPRQVSPLESLSARERQILQLVSEGKTSAAIAEALSLSPKTVDTYRSRLMEKLGLGDVAALVKFAVLHGLTPLE